MKDGYFKHRIENFQKTIDSEQSKFNRDCYLVNIRKTKRHEEHSKRRIIPNINSPKSMSLLAYCPNLGLLSTKEKLEIISEHILKRINLVETFRYMNHVINTCDNPEELQTIIPLLLSLKGYEFKQEIAWAMMDYTYVFSEGS